MRNFVWTCSLATALCAVASGARAAEIAFAPALNVVSASTDILPVGPVDRAYVFTTGNLSLNINGVAFTPMGPGATVGTDSNDFANTYNGYGAVATATGDYATLLTNGDYRDAGPPAAGMITLGGLTAGTTYTVQVFVNDTRPCCAGTRDEVISGDVGVGSVPATITYINGSYSIGTFVADGTGTQIINFSATDGDVQVNGLLLSHAVPEPTTAVLFGLGAVGLALAARYRKH